MPRLTHHQPPDEHRSTATRVASSHRSIASAREYADLLRRLPPPEERRAIRERAGVSQAFVARDLDVSGSLVGKWENGSTPSRRLLRAYIDLLDALRGEPTEGNAS